jgi:hypothetical protein
MKEGSKHTEETKAKIAESMLDNLNAEKWTEELVIDLLNQMIKFAVSTYEITIGTTDKKKQDEQGFSKEETIKKTKRGVHLKSKLLIQFEIWNADWFSFMKEKFSKEGQKSETVLRTLKVIDMICMTNTYNDAVNGTVNAATAKMNLTNNYGWEDKSLLETKKKDPPTEAELDAEIALYKKNNPEG